MIETLALGALVGGDWLARTWIPRQRAALLCPAELRRGPRLAPRLTSSPLDPIGAGIVPCRTILGTTDAGRYRQARAGHGTVVFGPPRAGKTAGIVIPNALSWASSQIVTTGAVRRIDGRVARLAGCAAVPTAKAGNCMIAVSGETKAASGSSVNDERNRALRAEKPSS